MKKQTIENGSCNSNYTVNGFHDNEQASMMFSTLELIFPQHSMSTNIWCRNFLEAQGYDMPPVVERLILMSKPSLMLVHYHENH